MSNSAYEITLNRKFYGNVEDYGVDPRFEDQVCSLVTRTKCMVPNNGLCMTSRGSVKESQLGSPNALQISHPRNYPDFPSRSSKGGGTPPARHGSPRQILPDNWQDTRSSSTGSKSRNLCYANVLGQNQSGSGTRSLSSCEMRVRVVKYQTKDTISSWMGAGSVPSGTISPRPSQRVDILKGLA